MTKKAAIRWTKDGIRVNSVHPAFIETPLIAEARADEQLSELILASTPAGSPGGPTRSPRRSPSSRARARGG
jgi:NAD(P)-dependent dehydrogenase (short-subunit alcohol dehydrogenase family)